MMRPMPPMTPPTMAPTSGLEALLFVLSAPVVAPGVAPDEVGVEVLLERAVSNCCVIWSRAAYVVSLCANPTLAPNTSKALSCPQGSSWSKAGPCHMGEYWLLSGKDARSWRALYCTRSIREVEGHRLHRQHEPAQ